MKPVNRNPEYERIVKKECKASFLTALCKKSLAVFVIGTFLMMFMEIFEPKDLIKAYHEYDEYFIGVTFLALAVVVTTFVRIIFIKIELMEDRLEDIRKTVMVGAGKESEVKNVEDGAFDY